jgi:type VI secretion system protein ImpH
MATTRRRKSLSVIDQIKSEPYRFEFFQAVRMLERAAALDPSEYRFASEPVAQQARPNQEAVRFNARQSLAFQASDISNVSTRDTDDCEDSNNPDKQWLMEVCFMGLTGSQGVMPYYLSEVVLQELKNKSPALKDYLDLFNHRSISLFFQAWHKYQLPANYERQKQQGDRQPDLFTHALMALSGLGTQELQYRLPIPDEAIAGFAGFTGREQCTADSLSRMIKQYFDLDVSIQQFQGQWQDLPYDVLSRLPGPEVPRGLNNVLGSNALLGSSCYHIQSKFSVIVEPMPYDKFMSIAPGSKKLEALKAFIRFSAGIELDFDIQVTLCDKEVPPVQLNETEDYQPLLGWNTHATHEPIERDPIVITLSQDMYAPDDSLPLAS